MPKTVQASYELGALIESDLVILKSNQQLECRKTVILSRNQETVEFHGLKWVLEYSLRPLIWTS